jgi:hypothetical protein
MTVRNTLGPNVSRRCSSTWREREVRTSYMQGRMPRISIGNPASRMVFTMPRIFSSPFRAMYWVWSGISREPEYTIPIRERAPSDGGQSTMTKSNPRIPARASFNTRG